MTRPSKYGNRKTVVDGICFASERESRRYLDLKLLQRAGEITHLQLQPRYPLVVNGQTVGHYVADFAFVDAKSGRQVIEDVKSDITRKLPVYRLKAKMMAAMGLQVVEV